MLQAALADLTHIDLREKHSCISCNEEDEEMSYDDEKLEIRNEARLRLLNAEKVGTFEHGSIYSLTSSCFTFNTV